MPCDYSKYPPNWKSEIRPRILARAGDCCEHCGIENGAMGWRGGDGSFVYAPDYLRAKTIKSGFYIRRFVNPQDSDGRMRIVLTIAHLDHDPENWQVQDDRLAALCQYCHLKYDAPRKAQERRAKKEATKSIGLFNE